MQLSDSHFQILDALDREVICTQRQLAESSGISLGQANYVLRSLLKKGLVKIGNFRRSPDKVGYTYLLTPKGIEAKSRLAARFILSRLREYHGLRQRLAQRLSRIEELGHSRIVFVGPAAVRDLLLSVAKEAAMPFQLVSHFEIPDEISEIDPDTFDLVLYMDDEGQEEEWRNPPVPRERRMPLW